eukprot:symbB.v1.2.036669.t1/scaffold5227.1/size29621/2
MLKINRTITHLNLEQCGIGVEGIKALATALKLNDTAMAAVLSTNVAIERLNLGFCKIGDAGVEALASALRINRVLTHLRIHGNDVGAQGAQALASAPMVNRVVAAWNQDDSLSAKLPCRGPFEASTRLQALARALRMNQTMTRPDLTSSKIGDDDLKVLADALRINKTITRLLLHRNQIGDAGIQALADALRVNKTITDLGFCENQIGDNGMKALADALSINKTLVELRLSRNPIGDEGVKAWLLPPPLKPTRPSHLFLCRMTSSHMKESRPGTASEPFTGKTTSAKKRGPVPNTRGPVPNVRGPAPNVSPCRR